MTNAERAQKKLRRAEKEKYSRKLRDTPVRKSAGTEASAVRARHDLFIETYLGNGLNATAAAVAAGYSSATAGGIAADLMRKDYIKRRIAERQAALQVAAELTSAEVAANLAASHRFDRRELYDPATGKLRPVHELSFLAAQHLEGLEVDYVRGRGTVAKVKLTKHLAVRDQCMRMFGMYAKEDAKAIDPDEATRLVREKLGNIDALTTGRIKAGEKQ